MISFSSMWGYSEKASICKPGSGLSPRTEPASLLIFHFSASRTMWNKCFLFKPPSLWYSLQQPKLRHLYNPLPCDYDGILTPIIRFLISGLQVNQVGDYLGGPDLIGWVLKEKNGSMRGYGGDLVARTREWSLGSDSGHWLIVSKTMGTSVLRPKGKESSQEPEEAWKFVFP